MALMVKNNDMMDHFVKLCKTSYIVILNISSSSEVGTEIDSNTIKLLLLKSYLFLFTWITCFKLRIMFSICVFSSVEILISSLIIFETFAISTSMLWSLEKKLKKLQN